MPGGKRGARSQLVVLEQMARDRLRVAIEVAGKVLRDEPLSRAERADEAIVENQVAVKPRPRVTIAYSVEDKMRAAEFLRRVSGQDRQPATKGVRTHMGVLRKSEGEAAEVLKDGEERT